MVAVVLVLVLVLVGVGGGGGCEVRSNGLQGLTQLCHARRLVFLPQHKI